MAGWPSDPATRQGTSHPLFAAQAVERSGTTLSERATAFPSLSPGVLWAPLGPDVLAYDVVTELAFVLNGPAGAVFASCEGNESLTRSINDWAASTGATAARVEADVVGALRSFESTGLVGRTRPVPRPTRWGSRDDRPASGWTQGKVHRVIDHAVAFRSPDPALIAATDEYLGTGGTADEVSVFIDVERDADGVITASADRPHRYPTELAWFDGVTSLLNEGAARSKTCLALHAGAVRSPRGRIVVLPAPSGAGKSTLTAAFVKSGWDYLGDEVIGVRADTLTAVGYPKRLSLQGPGLQRFAGAGAREHDVDPADLRPDVARLTGDVGPVALVVLPRFVEGATTEVRGLSPRLAGQELLANSLNVAGAGNLALDAVCALATNVPVESLTHSDSHEAVEVVTSRCH